MSDEPKIYCAGGAVRFSLKPAAQPFPWSATVREKHGIPGISAFRSGVSIQ
jgi:hypothetical protein